MIKRIQIKIFLDSEGGDARKEEAEREAAELRRMTAEEVAAAIRSGEMVRKMHTCTKAQVYLTTISHW